MEGQKRRLLFQDCRGVSEVYGQLLMMSIVVLAFSTIAITVFSDGGAVKPEHIPNTDLSENINLDTNDIKIVHSGGETIDLSSIKIILNVNGLQVVPPYVPPYDTSVTNFTVIDSDDTLRDKDDDGTYSSNNIFSLGDCIVINTNKTRDPAYPDDKTKTLDLKTTDDIDMFFVDTPSQQVIQKAVLQKGVRQSEYPYWITPHPYGSVYDNDTGEWLPTELVDGISDNLLTETLVSKDNWTSENFTFGIDEYGLELKNPLTKVELKVVYTIHDDSQVTLALEINDKNPDQWITVVPSSTLEKHKTIEDTDKNCVFDITDKVTTTEELRNLTVRFSGYGNAATDKYFWIDFIGIHAQ